MVDKDDIRQAEVAAEARFKEYFDSQLKWVDKHFQHQIDSVNKLFDVKTMALDRFFQSKIADLTKLIERAEVALESRLREIKQANYATQDDVKDVKTVADERLKTLENAKSNTEGKAAIISVVVAVLTTILVSQFFN